MFKSRRESPGTFKGLGAFRTIGWVDNLAFEAMITVKEISKNIRGEQEHSAGTRLSLRDIIKRDPQFTQLMELFKLWLVSGTVPDMVKECWTVLISKSSLSECQKDTNNW